MHFTSSDQSVRRSPQVCRTISRREVLRTAGALAGSALAGPALLRGQPRRPNVLLIIADDLAAWMTGCYGNQVIRTPHIDRLAAAGTRFRKRLRLYPHLLSQPRDADDGTDPLMSRIELLPYEEVRGCR